MTAKRKLLMAICSGAVLALAMPKPGISVLAWIGLAPLLAALDGSRWTRAALLGFLTGLVYFSIILYWIWLFGYLPWALLAIAQAVYYALFGLVASRLMPSRIGWWGYIAVPAAWTAMQWSRSLGIYAFPWGGFAHVLANDTPVIQVASITGVWGIEFLVCAFNLTIAEVALHRRRSWAAVAVPVIVAAVVLGGFFETPRAASPHAGRKIAIIQQNMEHDVVPEYGYVTDSFDACVKMSIPAAKAGAKLIVWPETALPTEITDNGCGASIAALASATRTEYLVGGYDPGPKSTNGSYNAAHLYGVDGVKKGVYRKVHLVPFGEFVPLRNLLPFLKNYAIRDRDVLPGNEHVLLNSRIGRLGVSICFESLFPQIARQETANGAEVLVVTTNDSWFAHTQAARQHLMMSKLRAVENRRYVIRAALTGISAIIDPWGRAVREIGLFKRGVLIGDVTPLHRLTIFTRLGQYFAYLCALITLGSLVWGQRAKAGQLRRVGRTTQAPRLQVGDSPNPPHPNPA